MSHNELPGQRADMNQQDLNMLRATQGETIPASEVKAALGEQRQAAQSPGIPGDDIPLTEAELKHMDSLIGQLVPPAAPKFFTPPPVKSCRVLSEVELNMMNFIKTEGEGLDSLIKVVQGHLLMQRREAARLPVVESDKELARLSKAEGERWAAIARTHFQEGLMALTRAVAQPSNF